jgi:hypothetical protein
MFGPDYIGQQLHHVASSKVINVKVKISKDISTGMMDGL